MESLYDIRIVNAHLYDPGNGIDRLGELCISKNRITDQLEGKKDTLTVDAQEDYVIPGLVDFHTHIGFGSSDVGAVADSNFLCNCVTSAIDAGTYGVSNIDHMMTNVIPRSQMDIACLLNLSPTGMSTSKYGECLDPLYVDEERIFDAFSRYPDRIIGLKIRVMKKTFTGYEKYQLHPLERAIAIADKLNVFVAVHVTDPPCSYKSIMELLRPGDIFVHPYQNKGETIINGDGCIDTCIIAAKERGVLFDLAGDEYNQSYAVAKKAIEYGMFPDIISTDIVRKSVYIKPAFSLLYIISAYANLGIPFERLITGATSLPYRLMHKNGPYGLINGSIADVCMIKDKKMPHVFSDAFNHSFEGTHLYEPRMTIKDGCVMYMNMEVKQSFSW